MSGIKPEKWSTDNPFVDQQPAEQWSADNPFTDQTAPVALAEAPKTPDEGSHPILSGIGQAVKEAVVGTAQFVTEVARPLDVRPPIMDKLLGRREEPDTVKHPSGLELLKGAVLAPFEMIAGGGKEALEPGSTTKQRAHGSATAVLGALGLLGGVHGVGKFREALKAKSELVVPPTPAVGTPPTAAPPTGVTPLTFAEARTPEERQAVVDQLAKQGAANEAAQKLKKGNFIKTVLTWNTLSAEQRGVIVKGLAITDYAKTWKELGRDARATVTKALGLDSGTNLDTSAEPTVPSAPPIPPTTGLPQETVVPAPSVRPTSKAATERIIKDIESEKLDLSHYTDADIEAAYHLLDNPHSSYSEHTQGPTELMDNPLTDAHSRAYRAALDEESAKRAPYKPDVPPLTPEEQAVPTGRPPTYPGETAAAAMGKTPDEVLKAIDPNSQAPGRATTPEQRASIERIAQTPEAIKPDQIGNVADLPNEQVQALGRGVKGWVEGKTINEQPQHVVDSFVEAIFGKDKLDALKDGTINNASDPLPAEPIPPQIKALSDDALRGAIEVYRDRVSKASDPADVADNTQLADMLQRELDSRQAPPAATGDAGTGTTEPPPDLVVEDPASQAPKEPVAPSGEAAPLNGQPPVEPTPQDQLTLMREGVEPLDPDRLQKIEQSIEDQQAVDKLIEHVGDLTPEEIQQRLNALDDSIDHLDMLVDKGMIDNANYEKQIYEIAESKKRLRALNPESVVRPPNAKFKMPDTVGKDLNKFSNDQLTMAKKSIGALLRSPDIAKLPESSILRQELDRIFDYEAQIRKASEGGAGPALSIKKIDVSGAPNYEQYFSKKIVLEPDLKSPWNFVKFMRKMYQGFVRPSHALNVTDRLYEGATGEQLQSHKMAGKLMEMADGSMTQAETFLRGDGPFVPGPNGELVKTGAKSLADIVVNTAKGDVERLGWLWAARRALDLKALRNKSIGIDLGYAQELAVNSSREMHTAVDEARAFHSSLSLFSQIRGLISPEARSAFEQETSYGPIQRMFGPKEIVSKVAQTINKSGRTAETIMASDEFKRLKGSDLLIRNMVESTIDVTHRILRAAKINEIANALYDQVEAQPDLFRGMVDKFEHREHLQIMRDISARASAVKAMFKESGIDISPEHAHLFANLLSDNALDVQGGKLLVWRGGEIKALKVDELIANSLKSLTPNEMPFWVKAMGMPARGARIGIVLDPLFMVGQILNDQFQGWFNTKYNFTPVLHTFKGWWNIVNNTEAFKEAQRAGGIEKSSLRGKTTLRDILAGPNLTPGELAFNQIKTMHPFKALQTIITPLREATRMGEYLQARGHGATPIEAAWAARDLLGNYSMQGTFALIRGLNHMSLFLGPAIAVTDKTFRTIRERPVQWFTRATTLAGVSALLYMANDGDEEIEQNRQTPGGQRWWFFRVGGEIVKVRKPYLEGAVFASGMEAFLDMKKGENPEAFKLWLQAQRQELALNMLPVMGVIPFQLWANKDTYSGAPIIPEGQQGLDPQFQTGYYSGSAERIVGKTTGIPPAILSYVVRGTTGYLGESFVKGVSAAIDWSNTGELPPVEDLPLTQRAFAKYPSYSVKPIQDFYKLAETVDRAAKTINYAAQHSPDDIEDVLLAHEAELPMIELFNDSRQQIADLRRAITSVEDLKDLGPASKKLYTDEYLRSIIEIAGATVQVAREMQSQGVQ